MKQQVSFVSDFDESLLFGYVWAFVQFLAQKRGMQVTPDILNSFIRYEEHFGITHEQVIKFEGEFYHTDTYKEMTLDAVALRVLWMIQKHPKFVFGDILTYRFAVHSWATELLLPTGLIRKCVHTDHKSKVENYAHFGEVGFYFEDSVKDAYAVAETYPHITVFIIRQPWNRIDIARLDYVSLANLHIVNDWHQIGRKVENILVTI